MAHRTFADLPRPAVTVDIVVLTIVDDALRVLLVERGVPPYQGQRALPGGFVHVGAGGRGGESVDEAAARELAEETGLDDRRVLLAQLGAFGAPGRDPRGRTITVAYYALVRPELVPFVRAGSDAAGAQFVDLREVLGKKRAQLAFDHDEILRATLAHITKEIDRSALALALVGATFTMSELRAVFECIHQRPLDPGNFRRRFLRLVEDKVIAPAPGKRATGKRPAKVWRAR